MDSVDLFGAHLEELGSTVNRCLLQMREEVLGAAHLLKEALYAGHSVYAFGNGGSAMQAQHLVAELVVRYKDDRRAFPAVALTADQAILTACANDYDFSRIFTRQIEGLGKSGDVAFGLSTSGKSPNVLGALALAKEKGMRTILLTGEKGRAEAGKWDCLLAVPSLETAHIQEMHLAVIHILCRYVDGGLGERQDETYHC